MIRTATTQKNQNSSPKINCEIHIDAEDHLNNNDFGPTEQQFLNNSNNIKDSTVIQNPPSNGGIHFFIVVEHGSQAMEITTFHLTCPK